MPPGSKTSRSSRAHSSGRGGSRLGLWVLLGITLILLAFAVVRLIPTPRGPGRAPAAIRPAPARPHQPPPAAPPPAPAASRAEAPAPAPPPAAPRPESGARCAIIIDDVGYNQAVLREFLDLDLPLSFAVFPRLADSRRAAQAASQAGRTVLLHLPMEPVEASKIRLMGPGGVTTALSDAEIQAEVSGDLESVGSAAGINNHMGSKATADPRVMKAVMRVARSRGLFFVDSLTTPQSVAGEAARDLGVPFARRDVFLDTDVSGEQGIRERITALIARAKEHGSAIGIGHAHPLTAQVLREMSGDFEREGVRVVPAGDLAAASE